MPRTPRVQENRRAGRRPFYTIRVNRRKHYLGTDPAKAHAKASRILAAGGQVEHGPEVVAELALRYSAHEGGGWITWPIKAFSKFVGGLRCVDVPAELLTDFAGHLQGLKRSPATVRKYVRAARAALEWAAGLGWIDAAPPMPRRLPRPVQHPRDIERGRLRSTFGTLSGPAAKALRFILFTGCRPGEACRLHWGQVNLCAGTAVLVTHKTAGKTGRTRTLYLTQQAAEVLAETRAEDRHGFVFLSSRGQPYTPGGLRSILRRQGIPSVYSLRHTFAQTSLDGGMAAEDVARLLGHRDLRMIGVYAQVRDQRAKAAAARHRSALD
ncbi:MAG: tyrosine-type recombinase/integrase [Planctomycetota bacterium]|jgi:integrase